MKMPLNFAILQYFTTVERASADEVIAALAPEYGNYRGLRRSAVEEALKTAEVNGLLEVAGVEMDAEDHLLVYYTANDESRQTIHKYLD